MRRRAGRAATLLLAAAACLPLAACDMGQPAAESRATWIIKPSLTLLDTEPITATGAVALASDESILRWADGKESVELPAGSRINALGSVPGRGVLAVGDMGAVWERQEGGWRRSWAAGFADLYAIWGSAWDDIFVAGRRGKICHFDGRAWSEMESGTDRNLYAMAGLAPDDVYAAGERGTVVHWDGTSWTQESVPSYSYCLTALAVTPAAAYALDTSAIYRRRDGRWEVLRRFDWRVTMGDLAWSPDRPWLVAVGKPGQAMRWDETSEQWSDHAAGTDRALCAAAMDADGALWAVGSAGTWMLRDPQGEWRCLTSGLTSTFAGICRLRPDRLLIGGRFVDHIGGAWGFTVSSDEVDCGVLLAQPASPFLVAPADYLSGPEIAAVADVWSPEPGCAVAVGPDGLMKLENGAWSRLDSPVFGARAVHGRSLEDFWVMGGYDLSHWSGGKWSTAPLLPVAVGEDLWVSPEGALLALGSEGIWRLEADGWNQEHPGSWTALWGDSAAGVLAVGEGGRIARRQGGVWHAEASGTSDDLAAVWGRALTTLPGAPLREAWAVGRQSIVRYDGRRWQPVEPPPGVERTSLTGVCGGPDGGVFIVTANGGLFSHFRYPLD